MLHMIFSIFFGGDLLAWHYNLCAVFFSSLFQHSAWSKKVFVLLLAVSGCWEGDRYDMYGIH